MAEQANHVRYDEVEYLSAPMRECDPLWMATIANLYGLPTADPATCDVLDIGCGDGGNLLSLANAYPGVRAVGLDPAEVAIGRGRQILEQAGLTNVELLTELGDRPIDATADYVIEHGVLSWVGDETREEVVALASRALRPGGLVSFSYRTYPYAHYEYAAREMANTAIEIEVERAAERGETLTWQEKAQVGRERIRLAARLAGPSSLHGQVLAAMVAKGETQPDWEFFHDDLSDPLRAFRFSEVVELAGRHGLTYVGELSAPDLWHHRIDAAAADLIRELGGPSAARRQQVADDLMGNGFHASLFVKADEVPPLEPSPEGVTLHVRQYVHGTADGPRRADAISAPVAQVIREHELGTITAQGIADDLGRDLGYVHDALLKMYTNGLAQITSHEPPVPAAPGERPRTNPLAAAQLEGTDPIVATRFHRGAQLPAGAQRELFRLTDGTRDREALRRDLPAAASHDPQGVASVLASLDELLEIGAVTGILAAPDA